MKAGRGVKRGLVSKENGAVVEEEKRSKSRRNREEGRESRR